MPRMEVFFPGSSRATQKFAIEVLEIGAGGTLSINGVTVTAFEAQHACPAPPLPPRFNCDSKTIAYSGEAEWTDVLVEAGRGAELCIAEALFFAKRISIHSIIGHVCGTQRARTSM